MIKKYCIAIIFSLFFGIIYHADMHLFFFSFSVRSAWADATGEIRKDYLGLDSIQEDCEIGDCIMVNNKRFRVSETTVIINSSGKTISLDKLSVPCRARMTYYHNPAENLFEVMTVEVLAESSLIY